MLVRRQVLIVVVVDDAGALHTVREVVLADILEVQADPVVDPVAQ